MGLMKDNKVKDYRYKKKLNENERVLIEHYYTKKKIKNYSYIAKEIWRDRKTIEREIKRNRYSNVWWHWVYKADIAKKRTYKRRKDANRKHTKLFTRKWRKFVEKIKEAMKKEWWSISASIGRYEYEKKKKRKIAIYYTWMNIYFARPYHSRERWTNENTNWLIRQFFPKWTDFSKIDKNYLKEVIDLINNRPRKRLWFKTPYEYFFPS